MSPSAASRNFLEAIGMDTENPRYANDLPRARVEDLVARRYPSRAHAKPGEPAEVPVAAGLEDEARERIAGRRHDLGSRSRIGRGGARGFVGGGQVIGYGVEEQGSRSVGEGGSAKHRSRAPRQGRRAQGRAELLRRAISSGYEILYQPRVADGYLGAGATRQGQDEGGPGTRERPRRARAG